MHHTRRQVLGALAAAGAATLVDPGKVLAKLAADVPCTASGPAGELLGTLPLFRDRAQVQAFGVKYGGAGLDARLVTDLSLLEPGKLITPNDLAYIRTEIPPAAAAHAGPWTIETSGLLAKDGTLNLDAIAKQSKSMGPHLFECSGNANPSNFGLMSVADWEGIPLTSVVAGLKPTKDATAVLVSGFDHVGQVSQRSIVGASWVFPLASLDKLGAFLAVRMNGEPVPADHGKPVRLVVPGWYGCTWIKWVNEIRLVGPDEAATTQMVEFANRTHQAEPFKLAKDYTPADIQTAATPVRIEKRRYCRRHRIPDGWHRVGRHQGRGSAGGQNHAFGGEAAAVRQGRRVHSVCGVPYAEDARHVESLGIPLEAHCAWHLRHRAEGGRCLGAAASARDRVLHAPGEDRRGLTTKDAKGTTKDTTMILVFACFERFVVAI